jgi:capsid protein
MTNSELKAKLALWPDDAYLDDRDHEALAAKFWRDYQGKTIDWCDPVKDAAAKTQKLRDARDVQEKWLAEQDFT